MNFDPARLAEYLSRQRWFGESDIVPASVSIVDQTVLRSDWPMLVRLLLRLESASPTLYQVLLGVREMGSSAEFLRGNEGAVFGEVDTDAGRGFAYEATLDPALGLALIELAAPPASVSMVRRPSAQQTHTSLIYDDRLIMKLYRRLADGPNTEVEVTRRLMHDGFPHVPELIATWRYEGCDLAIVQRYLSGGTDGWSLALTSLRDVFALHDTQQIPVIRPDGPEPEVGPADAGGDFAAEAERLGAMTGALHHALAEAFGRRSGNAKEWSEAIRRLVVQHSSKLPEPDRLLELSERVKTVPEVGPAIRTHGDYHLGQVMRTDRGWYVLDFEGEPARPYEHKSAYTSPLRDVAGMLRSFHYASQIALRERGTEVSSEMIDTAQAWERRNREAFLAGYLPRAHASRLLPLGSGAVNEILSAFELEKAVYEVGYEAAHRPDWVDIPLDGLHRILGPA